MHDPHDDERFDAPIRNAYRQPLTGEAAAARRALERLGRERRAPHAWFAPHALRLHPAAALALSLALLGAGAYLGARWSAWRSAGAPLVVAAPVAAGSRGAVVTFVLRAPGATRVTVAGDFNGWDAEATPLARAGSGDTWTVRVTVPQGMHYYSFVLDGAEWRPDPSAPLAPEAGFGSRNSVLVVSEEGAS